MRILAIETSCDETAVAVFEAQDNINRPNFKILSNIISSQIKIHRPFGGVVPNLAKREHQRNLVPVLTKALKQGGLLKISNRSLLGSKQTSKSKMQIIKTILEREPLLSKKTIFFLQKYQTPKIDLIAVTQGPGLAPALWPGINFAKALSFFWNKPIIGINHLEGHIFANWLNKELTNSFFQFPIVVLIISGGHTQLVLMEKLGKYKLLGETRDDATGECFDKTARILDLGYPGGPAIAQAAEQWKSQFLNLKPKTNTRCQIKNIKYQIRLPRPMINTKDYDFSFSGLKTAVLYLVKEIEKSQKITKEIRLAIAAEIQQAVIDVLVLKTLRAAKNFHAKTIMLAGGVAANKELRKQITEAIKKRFSNMSIFTPDFQFCTDNAAMIAAAAYFTNKWKKAISWKKLKADANLRLA